MKKTYDIIAFDLDGTLSDPAKGLVDGFVYAFRKMGIDYGEREALKRFIGPPLIETWMPEFGFSFEEAERAVILFREFYNIYGWWDNKVYSGIYEMLNKLKVSGKRIFLATSKPENTAKKIMSLFELDKYFDFLGGASGDTRDHKWQVLDYSMKSIGAVPEKTVLVGDRIYDAEGADKCGIDSFGEFTV